MTAAVMAASFSTAYFRLQSLRMTCRSHDIVKHAPGTANTDPPSNDLRTVSCHCTFCS